MFEQFSFVSECQQADLGYGIKEYRIDKPEMLMGPDSIREIAWKVGYENQSKFARLFREKMNCSPSEYRQKHRKT